MLHSVAAQAEYMVALLDSLQDLTMFAMERERWKGANLPRPTSGTPDEEEEEESPPLVDDEEEEMKVRPRAFRTCPCVNGFVELLAALTVAKKTCALGTSWTQGLSPLPNETKDNYTCVSGSLRMPGVDVMVTIRAFS